MASLPGTWKLNYSWGCSTSYASTTLTLNANGTWSNGQGYTGKWVQNEGMFIQNFDGSATIYAGNIAGNVIAGTMTTFSGLNGCWYATKSGVAALSASKAKATGDTSGSKATKGASKKGSKKR